MQRGSAPLIILLILLVVSFVLGFIIFDRTKPPTKDPERVKTENTNSKASPTSLPSDKGFLEQTFLNPKPTQSPVVEEEKTYRAKNLDFELKYSNPMEAREDSEAEFNKRGGGDFRKNFSGYVGYEPGKVLEAVAVLGTDKSFVDAPFAVWVFENSTGLDETGWYNRYWYYPFLWGDFDPATTVHVFPKDEATISGKISKSAVVYYQPGKPRLILLAKDGKMYLFRIFTDSARRSQGEKILASFKFTK